MTARLHNILRSIEDIRRELDAVRDEGNFPRRSHEDLALRLAVNHLSTMKICVSGCLDRVNAAELRKAAGESAGNRDTSGLLDRLTRPAKPARA